MSQNSRRRFFSHIIGAGVGLGAVSAMPLAPKEKMNEVPVKSLPVHHEADICILGGSCTGVFAAVRAAQAGAKVIVIEKQNCFGGMLTAGLVHYWHSLQDTEFKKTIIAGLTEKFLERLKARQSAQFFPDKTNAWKLNTEEAKVELDTLVLEHRITPLLNTFFSAPVIENGKLTAILVENKSGRQAVRAKVFVDATGDGDLAAASGCPFRLSSRLQPPTTCARIQGLQGYPNDEFRRLYNLHREEFGLAHDWGWRSEFPGSSDVLLHAETHVFKADLLSGEGLTRAEMEGRRQVRALMDLLKKYGKLERPINLLTLAASIGIRHTRQFDCLHRLTEAEVLEGVRFDDAIANGSYRVDIHNSDNGEIILKYMDGTEERNLTTGAFKGRWRPERPVNPTFYQIPLRCLIPLKGPDNLIIAGRLLDTDEGAYGAVRVMINCNQMGEAAGVASSLALHQNVGIRAVDFNHVRRELKRGGSVII